MYIYNFQLTIQNFFQKPLAKHEANKMEKISNAKDITFIFNYM